MYQGGGERMMMRQKEKQTMEEGTERARGKEGCVFEKWTESQLLRLGECKERMSEGRRVDGKEASFHPQLNRSHGCRNLRLYCRCSNEKEREYSSCCEKWGCFSGCHSCHIYIRHCATQLCKNTKLCIMWQFCSSAFAADLRSECPAVPTRRLSNHFLFGTKGRGNFFQEHASNSVISNGIISLLTKFEITTMVLSRFIRSF